MSVETHDICQHLDELAREEPSRLAVIGPDGRQLTTGQLNELSNRCAMGLVRAGIRPGSRTALMVTPGIEFMVLTFALLRAGAVLVIVDPGIGWDKLGDCLAQARPEAFVGIPRAHVGRILFGWGRATMRVRVTTGSLRLPGWVSYRKLLQEVPGEQPAPSFIREPDQTAAIVFTSGSTGPPKGVVYTHRMFIAQAQLLQEHFGVQPGEIDLATFPLFGLFDPAMRVTAVFPEMDFTRPGQADPATIVDTLRRLKITHMFGSPALLDRLGRYGEEHKLKLYGLRRVLSAGAPVPTHILRRIQAMLADGACVHTPYGATEALPVCSISAAEVLSEDPTGRGVCVGRPLACVGLAVIRISDQPILEWSDSLLLPEGEIGELVVWGENVSRTYFERPAANRLAKIRVGRGEVRHRMGDVGFLDEHGRVWFCGRKSQRVITDRGTLFTIPCESVFNQHPEVLRTALVGVGHRRHQCPVLCVELEASSQRAEKKRIRRQLLELGASHSVTCPIRKILFHPRFPVDARHNAKIFREKLAVWAEAQLRKGAG